MSRTDLDVATIANCLRARAGDGSLEWVAGAIRASVLLDAADMLDRFEQEHEAVGTAAYLYGRTELALENAELRERLKASDDGRERQADNLIDKHHKIAQLQTDNAKLRELVHHMHECMSNVDADGNHECFVCEYENAECEFDRRMRELGIEVPE